MFDIRNDNRLIFLKIYDLDTSKVTRLLMNVYLNLTIFYDVYIGMLAVFCTNAINIFAGFNGIEVGQWFIIAISILIENLVEFNGLWFFFYFSIIY